MINQIKSWLATRKQALVVKQQELLKESKRSDCPKCGAKADPIYMHGKKTGEFHCWNCQNEYHA